MLIFTACCVIALGGFVQGAMGFGLAIVAAPVLYLIDPTWVPVPIILVALVISALGTWRNRSQVHAKGIGAALIGRIPGGFLALLVLGQGHQMISMMIAGSVLLSVAVSLSKLHITPTRNSMLLAGFFSGLFGTASSIGGPPIALVMQHEKASSVRANLSAYFTISCLMSLATLAWGGFLGTEQLMASLWLLPAGIFGFFCAQPIAGKLKQSQFRPLLLTVCSLAAVGVLAKPLLGG